MTAYDDKNDVCIYLRELPGNIRAFSLCGEHGKIVVINSALTDRAMKKSYQHELLHFNHGDHDNQDYQEYT